MGKIDRAGRWSRAEFIEKFQDALDIYGENVTSKEFCVNAGLKSYVHANTFQRCGFKTGWKGLRAHFGLKTVGRVGQHPMIWTKAFIRECLISFIEKLKKKDRTKNDCTLGQFRDETGISSGAIAREWESWNKLKKDCGLPVSVARGGHSK